MFLVWVAIWATVAFFSGVVGYRIGRTRQKCRGGFWLGYFLGPFGWLAVSLLPRSAPEPA
jgi:hypothetical protein